MNVMHANGVDQVLTWLAGQVPASAHLTLDSRAVERGDVFLAYAGGRSDGRDYIQQAIERGAAAVVFEAQGEERVAGLHAMLAGHRVAACSVAGLKDMLGGLAAEWYGHPSRGMTVIAVTGTNGKTSCTQWLADALTANGQPCGVIGTLGIRLPESIAGKAHIATGLTTPDAVALHRALAGMQEAGAVAVAIEASSIGIAEGRMAGLDVDVAVFTNLTRDHLDYHGDMQTYEAEKAKLFAWPGLRAAVINLDDAAGQRIQQRLSTDTSSASVSVTGFTLQGVQAASAKTVLRAADLHGTSQGMVFTFEVAQRSVQIATPLLGAHNVANLLAVAGVLFELGWNLQQVARALSSAQAAPGRLESIAAAGEPAGAGVPLVVVDYAHSPDALERAIEALTPVAQARGGKRICVFGCGGDRDAGKRPVMGRIAHEKADLVVVTSDNPRSEAPLAIIDAIVAELPAQSRVQIEADRARAVRSAILAAAPQDVILLAGKGHEAYQEIAGKRYPFSDADEARRVLAEYPRPAASLEGFMSLADAASAMQGVLHGFGPTDGRACFTGISTDSRSVKPGELFFALSGERFDGHEYVAAVAQAGACACVVQRPVEGERTPQIVVDDTRLALGRLAHQWRGRFRIPLIGVTGSNGKTTTKEMIAAILAAWQGEAARLATSGNLNNDIGVPLTLLRLNAAHRSGVVELGMNHPGEIAYLSGIAAPTVGLVNNAQREHQEFMHTVEAVARENGAVIDHLAADGIAVYPGDDEHTPVWAELAGTRPQLRFGLSGEVDVSARDIDTQAFETRFTLVTPHGEAGVLLAAAGLHNVRNALAAAACALAVGVPLPVVADGLRRFSPVKGRMQRQSLHGGMLLIDDTYNANPDSARAAIDVLAGLPAPRVLVLGDMGEVGDQGPAMHREIGLYARERGVDALFTLGEATRDTTSAYAGAGAHAQSVEQIAPAVLALAPRSVLVKGSRFMRMERVVAALIASDDPSNNSSTGKRNAA